MNPLQRLDVSYPQWKNMRTFAGGTTNGYFIISPEGYIIVLVSLNHNIVVVCKLYHGNNSRNADVLDFETNLKSVSIEQNSVDDCIVAALIG